MDAREQAEIIKKRAQEKAEAVYKETYQKAIDDAKRKSIEMKEQAKNDAESEAQIFIKRAEKLKKKIRASAEQKISGAVDLILKEIL